MIRPNFHYFILLFYFIIYWRYFVGLRRGLRRLSRLARLSRPLASLVCARAPLRFSSFIRAFHVVPRLSRASLFLRERHTDTKTLTEVYRERERFTHTKIFTHIETDGEQENGVTGKARTTGEDWSEKKKHIIIRRAEFFTSSSSSLLCAGNFIFTTVFFLAMAQSNWEADKMWSLLMTWIPTFTSVLPFPLSAAGLLHLECVFVALCFALCLCVFLAGVLCVCMCICVCYWFWI